MTGRVEQPVARIRDDRLDGRDLLVGEEHARMDDVGMLASGGRQLRERGALRGVEQAAVKVDGDGLAEHPLRDIRRRVVLRVADVAGQDAEARLARGLRFDVRRCRLLEQFSTACRRRAGCDAHAHQYNRMHLVLVLAHDVEKLRYIPDFSESEELGSFCIGRGWAVGRVQNPV